MIVLSGNGVGADSSTSQVVQVQKAINAAAAARGLQQRGPEGGLFNEQNFAAVLAIARSVAGDQALLAQLEPRTRNGFQTIATGKVSFSDFEKLSVDNGDGVQDTLNAMTLVVQKSDPRLAQVPGGTKAWIMAGAGVAVISLALWFIGRK